MACKLALRQISTTEIVLAGSSSCPQEMTCKLSLTSVLGVQADSHTDVHNR
ncbi:hypothetical protein DPMN_056367 [Dreissena polymorpha]|uniref:Uncharacterized protein n=1 Tax=Dreissena polymorpha TaxID=45954 RepID=A0A9D4CRK0_DREPO|nr:hypothetical protein DPMN_056367 [Dreissena polymorpha]